MANILSTGISALTAFQQQLSTTGHNIANVNTEGFSRQRTQFDARVPFNAGAGFVGGGVDITSTRRVYDQFLIDRVRTYNASNAEHEIYYERARQVDNVIADASSGINDMLQEFFKSVQDVADDPTSIPARNVMLNRAEILTDRFQSLDTWFSTLRTQINADYVSAVDEINGLSQSIAQLNSQIQALSIDPANLPNDLLDERDKLIDDLSKLTNVTTFEQDDGSFNVFIGNGQSLVVGATYSTLSVTNSPEAADHKEIAISIGGGGTAIITNQLTGGKLGGLVRFRDEVLDPAHNALGQVALGLAENFNLEHVTGMDLDGDLGQNFFAVGPVDLLGNTFNTGTATASFDSIADITNHEYRVESDGTDWIVSNLSTGAAPVTLGPGAGPHVFDGVSITFSTAANAVPGDSYRVRPGRLGATHIESLITDARDIAAAAPVGTTGIASNTGTGAISAGAQTSSTGTTKIGAPFGPITLTFDDTVVPNRFNYASADGSFTGSFNYIPASDSGTTQTLSIPSLGDFSFEITGTPDNGDQFTLSDNTGGVGDNRNALRLASLQNAKLLQGSTASLSQTYGFMIGDVGTKTTQAENNAEVNKRLLQQAEAAKSAVSGVNLDEEAADLVRFQQAYQAAAQVINVANTLFDTLIGAVRR